MIFVSYAYSCQIINHSIALAKVSRLFSQIDSNSLRNDLQNEIRIVQASLLGSILANLLLILGMCLLFGGLRFREQVRNDYSEFAVLSHEIQIYNSTVTQMSACLLSLSVMSLLLPVCIASAKLLQ